MHSYNNDLMFCPVFRQAKCSTEKNELTVKVDQCERSVKTISGRPMATIIISCSRSNYCHIEQLRQQQDDMKNQRNDYLVKQQQGEDKRSAFPQHHEEG